jgi:hypothetical protein
MSKFFPIIEVPADAAEAAEEMGTKYKFWYRDANFGLCLFKKARENTGEDWAEKVAAELCQKINLPHVHYELATFQNQRGTISLSMLPEGGILQHGNEVLANLTTDYPTDKHYGVSQHTIELICQSLDTLNVEPPYDKTLPEGVTSAAGTFVGYLLLDTWIGNGDRHHENWGFIIKNNVNYLAPTYDHGSCLGRELSDDKRSRQSIEKYASKSRSAIYASASDAKPLLNLELFQRMAQLRPQAAAVWLQALAQVRADEIMEILAQVPQARLSPIAETFAHQLLLHNQQRLLAIQNKLQ